VLDAALIAGGQRAEHYEIAAYGTLAQFADLLGEQRAKDLLGVTLEEEKMADEKLSWIATSDVNRQALAADGDEADEAGGNARGVQRGLRRVAEAMGMVSTRRGPGRRPSKRGGASRAKQAGGTSSRTRRSGRSAKKR
jgi:hypothetical protein